MIWLDLIVILFDINEFFWKDLLSFVEFDTMALRKKLDVSNKFSSAHLTVSGVA